MCFSRMEAILIFRGGEYALRLTLRKEGRNGSEEEENERT